MTNREYTRYMSSLRQADAINREKIFAVIRAKYGKHEAQLVEKAVFARANRT